MLNDAEARLEATSPEGSYIVQAPAGSGKTEILSQRFLRLLAKVEAPEQIIALTFTRKAANEMRERILLALKKAEQGHQAESEHQQKTLSYAKDALKQSQRFNWNIIQQPARLKVMTIDSLCQSICQAIPIQDKQIPYAGICENPEQYFKQAAEHCIRHAMELPDYQKELMQILLHIDNRQDVLVDLFASLLSNREQWLELIYEGQAQQKDKYEEALKLIEQHEIERLCQSLPPSLGQHIVELGRELACIENLPESPRYKLKEWELFEDITAQRAKTLAAFLLTSKGDEFRKGFDHHIGLRKDSCSPDQFKRLKASGKQLFEELKQYPDFLNAMISVKDLPPPYYEQGQWEILQALFKLLPLLVAHLQLVFTEHQEVDFSAISQQALAALGDEEAPTDLALYLDHAIHHLLIDEFQDTSISQFQLMEKITAGWQQGDGRTLFVVGDPMQSIYRFRQAEVGLFLKAQHQGIGSVPLKALELKCNFRSSAQIVNWVNAQFRNIFPQQADIESGAVPFHASEAVREQMDDSYIEAWQFDGQEEEAQAFIRLLQKRLRQYPEQEIAVLVRSRNHLKEMIQLLRKEGIAFQGVDIDLLSQLPHIRDIWSLTQSLLMPANRLCWLSLLRSPYLGLPLQDIHRIALLPPQKSILLSLSRLDEIQGLSEDARLRARFFYQVMRSALKNRCKTSLADWIKSTHQALYGQHFLNEQQQNDLEQFYRLIEAHESDAQISDFKAFETALEHLYAKQNQPAKLQIMTIHKSKGLEFDCVILPGLGSAARNLDRPFLRWLRLPTEDHDDLLLLSPIKAAADDRNPLYEYLGQIEQQKYHYEMQRLLYVAATRAKKSLYLLDSKTKTTSASFRQLLNQVEFATIEKGGATSVDEEQKLPLLRLPSRFYQSDIDEPAQSRQQVPGLQNNTSAISGVIAHKILEWIGNHHPQTIDEIPWKIARQALRQEGFDPKQSEHIEQELKHWMHQLFHSDIGRWMMQAHDDEQNEYPLLVELNNKIQTRIIDRTFIDKGERWIIDFKTGSNDAKARTSHQKQLNEYKEIMKRRGEQKIRCGVFYLANGDWLSW